MHIVGSFSDTRGYSEELIYSVLRKNPVVYYVSSFYSYWECEVEISIFVFIYTADYIHKQPVEVDLITACVGELNTIVRGDIPWPIAYGVGINMKTGEIFPATFPDKGIYKITK